MRASSSLIVSMSDSSTRMQCASSARAQHADISQILYGRDAGRAPLYAAPREPLCERPSAFAQELIFGLRFGRVYHHRQVFGESEIRDQLKLTGADGIGRMRRHARARERALILSKPEDLFAQLLEMLPSQQRVRAERFLVHNPAKPHITKRTKAGARRVA